MKKQTGLLTSALSLSLMRQMKLVPAYFDSLLMFLLDSSYLNKVLV